MSEYHKIQTVYLRDPETKFRTLLEGQWARPEFEYLADCEWVWTEKVDGTNARLIWDGQAATIGGRNDSAQMPTRLVNRLSEIAPRLGGVFDAPAVVYGEGYGAKIQKGGGNYRPDGGDFVVFDVRVGDVWLDRVNVADVAAKLGIDVVPAVGRGPLRSAIEKVRGGLASRWGDFAAEGLVMRPAVELSDRIGRRIIAKIKARDFQ
jgi:hypothetical protein